MADPLAVDTVVLDIDGVLVDVSDSYRRTIVETVNRELNADLTRADVQRFKEAGGFNDDWDLTAAAALYVRAIRAGLNMDLDAFTAAIEERGGGRAAAEAIVREHLSADAAATVFDDWAPDHLREVFQALYLGETRYRELEWGDPPLVATGYINDETVLIREETLDALSSYELAVLTGRPRAEARIALERVGLEVPTHRCIAMEDVTDGKPDPAGLLRLAERCDSEALCFVGDTTDDVRTAARASRADDTRRYYSIGVLTGGLEGQRGRDVFQAAGADRVLASINDLPSTVTPNPG